MQESYQERIPKDIEQEMRQLASYTDEELWQSAQITASPVDEERIQELIDKQELISLTDSEKQEVAVISHKFTRIMLVRAESAVLLKERGYNIDRIIKK